jgi:hypothetical protein
MEDINVEVKLSFLLNMRAIVNVASQRGTFRPEEYKAVGSVYEQLQSYLPKQEEPASETETETETKNI